MVYYWQDEIERVAVMLDQQDLQAIAQLLNTTLDQRFEDFGKSIDQRFEDFGEVDRPAV